VRTAENLAFFEQIKTKFSDKK